MKKITKKQFILYFLIPLCSVLVVIIVWSVLKAELNFNSEREVQIENNAVDNDYNNREVLGIEELIQIGDRLYYNYARDEFNDGVYEITDHGSKRIYWNGYTLDEYMRGYCVRQYQDQLLLFEKADEVVKKYSPEQNEFVETDLPYQAFDFQEYENSIFYSDEQNRIIEIDRDGDRRVVLDRSVTSFYISDQKIYYYCCEETGDKDDPYRFFFRSFDLVTEEDVLIGQPENMFPTFIIEDQYALYDSEETVFCIDLRESSAPVKETVLFSAENIHSMNAWNKKLYICTDEGLFQYDLEQGKTKKLVSGNTVACYIVDDYWAYFVDDDSNLYRVAQKGSEVETVFSPSTLERIFGPVK